VSTTRRDRSAWRVRACEFSIGRAQRGSVPAHGVVAPWILTSIGMRAEIPSGTIRAMLGEAAAGASGSDGRRHAFWWRLTDNLFRRLGWFIIPVVVMTLVGFQQSRQTLNLFQTSATLSASTNPLLPEPQTVGGTSAQWWETPSDVTARIVNEQLRTDHFLTSVAESAGLGNALDSGLIDLGVVRANVGASKKGDVLFSISARWADPETALKLVEATITEYERYLVDTISTDSTAAEQYFQEQLTRVEGTRDAAEKELTDLIAGLPEADDEQTLPIPTQLEVDRLTSKIETAEGAVTATQAQLDNARIAREEKANFASRSFRVVDEPKLPGAPASTMSKSLMTVAAFFMFGVVISAAALLVTTVLDHTVASSADLLVLQGVPLVATVPQLSMSIAGQRSGRRLHWPGRRGRRR
jgi:hypothetical protein